MKINLVINENEWNILFKTDKDKDSLHLFYRNNGPFGVIHWQNNFF